MALSKLITCFLMLLMLKSCKDNPKVSYSKYSTLNETVVAMDGLDSINLKKSKAILDAAIAKVKSNTFNDETGQLLDSALAVFNKVKSPPASYLSTIYSYLDVYTYQTNQPKKNIDYNQTFISRYSKYKDAYLSKLLMSRSNLGYTYMDLGQSFEAINKAILPNKRLIDSLKKEKNSSIQKDSLQTAEVVNYRQLITAAQELENGKILKSAIEDFENFLNEDISNEAKVFLPYALSNLADVSIEIGNFEQAKKHIAHWDSLIPEDKYIDKLMMANLSLKMAIASNDTEALDSIYKNATKFYERVEDDNRFKDRFYAAIQYDYARLKFKNGYFNGNDLDSFFQNLSRISNKPNIMDKEAAKLFLYDLKLLKYFKTEHLDSIAFYLNKQKGLAQEFNKSDHLNKNLLHELNFSILKKDTLGLSKSIAIFLKRTGIEDINVIDPLDEVFKINLLGDINTAEIAIEAGQLILNFAIPTHNNDLVFKAHKLALLSGMLIDANKSKLNYNNFEKTLIDKVNDCLLRSRSHMGSLNKQALNAIDLALIGIIEQNKNSQLTIKNKINNITYKYPKAVVQLLDSINTLDIKIAQLKSNTQRSSSALTDSLKQVIETYQIEKNAYLLKLNTNATNDIANIILDFNIQDFKASLPEDACVVRFYQQESLYAFTITNSKIEFFNIGDTNDLDRHFSELLKKIRNIKSYDTERNKVEGYLEPLIKKVEEKHITIVPEGKIALLPLGLILQKNLEANSVLAYNTSLKLIKQNNVNKTNVALASYSPTYQFNASANNTYKRSMERNSNTYAIPFAAEEAMYVANLFNGHLYNGTAVNKDVLINTASNYGVLHLAMHAYVDGENEYNSKLLFQGTKNADHLNLNGIYNLKLNAQLTTLSACNTGYGRIDVEEGVLSLSRAFQYAGSDATLTSLWRVPDKETSLIMKRFYDHLKAGLAKDYALRQAKLDYLNSIDDPNLKHPYYWAGFVLTGDTAPIVKTGSNYLFYIVLGMVILMLGWFTIKKHLK